MPSYIPTVESLLRRAIDLFKSEYEHSPEIAAYGPGRVNLIGEHTDYNDGFVLPMVNWSGDFNYITLIASEVILMPYEFAINNILLKSTLLFPISNLTRDAVCRLNTDFCKILFFLGIASGHDSGRKSQRNQWN